MRLNVEDALFSDPRVARLAKEIRSTGQNLSDVDHLTALGMLCSFWHQSQKQGLIHVTEAQVDLWLFEGAAKILCKLQFLKEEPEGLRVAGNEEQLKGLQEWREQRRAAGKRSAERRAEQKTNGTSTAVQRPFNDRSTAVQRPFNEIQRDPNETQRNPRQLQVQDQIQDQKYQIQNTVCDEPETTDPKTGELVLLDPAPAGRKRPPKGTEGPTPGSQVWEAYSEAMQKGWNFTPPRSAKTAAQAKQLVELVGLENAMKIAAYYPTRRKDFYVKTGHPFGLLLEDHMALLREINAGIKLTKDVVKDIVSREETETTVQRMAIEKETNPFRMSDEEFAIWAKEQEALEASQQQQQLMGA
jgi:hypothetical protein